MGLFCSGLSLFVRIGLIYAYPLFPLDNFILVHFVRSNNSSTKSSRSLDVPKVLGRGGRAENISILTSDELDHNILVYNRAPKCGSIYMTRLLYLLGAGDRNVYTVQSPYEEGEKPFLRYGVNRAINDIVGDPCVFGPSIQTPFPHPKTNKKM